VRSLLEALGIVSCIQWATALWFLGCVCLWRWQDERRRERALRRREREQACWDAERFRAAWESPVETRR
jgi:hypothetical protein